MLQLFNNNNNRENSRDYFRERSNTSLLKRMLLIRNTINDNSSDKIERFNIIKTNENTITLLNKIDNDIYQIHNITLRKNDILQQLINAFNDADSFDLPTLLRRRLKGARARAIRRASRGSNRRANVRANNRSSRTQTNQQRSSSNNTNPRQAQNNTTRTNRTQQTQQVPRAQQTPSSVQPPNTSQAPASRLPVAPSAPPTTAPTTPSTPSTTQVTPRSVAPTIPPPVTPSTPPITPTITPPTSQAPTAPAAPQITSRPATPTPTLQAPAGSQVTAPIASTPPQTPITTPTTPSTTASTIPATPQATSSAGSTTAPSTITPQTNISTTSPQTSTSTQKSTRDRHRHLTHTRQNRVLNNETIREIAIKHASNGFNRILKTIPLLSAIIAAADEYEESKKEGRAAAVGAGHLGGTYAGAALGASIGSIVPGAGTLIGGLVGGVLGSMLGEEFAKTVYDIVEKYGDEGIKRLHGLINDVKDKIENNDTANTLFSELQQFFESKDVKEKILEDKTKAEIYELLRQGVNDGLIEIEQVEKIHNSINKREFPLETIRNNLQNELEKIKQERTQNTLQINKEKVQDIPQIEQERVQNRLQTEQEKITQNFEDNQAIQEIVINNLNDLINAINQYIDDPNERANFLNMAKRRHARLQPLIATLNSFMSKSNKKIRFIHNTRLSTNNTLPIRELLSLASFNITNDDDIEFTKFIEEQKEQSRIIEEIQEQRTLDTDIINFLNNNTFNEITFEAEELSFDGNISALIEALIELLISKNIINKNQIIKIPNQLIPIQYNQNLHSIQTALEVEKFSQNNQTTEIQKIYAQENRTVQANENNYNQQNEQNNNIHENDEPNEIIELQKQSEQNNELIRENTNTKNISNISNQQLQEQQTENQQNNQQANQNDFMAEVNRVSNKFGINPNDLLALMRSESSLNPQAVNPTTGATGLIQFMPKTARSLGTTVEELRNMNATQQMHFVEKYFESVNLPKGASAGTLYAYVFLPGRAKRQILAQAGENFYEANRGLDMNKDGMITIEDLDMRMAKYGGTMNRESTRMIANNQARLRRNDTNIIINTAQNSIPQENSQIIKNDSTMRREVSLLQRLEKLALIQI
jgi:hypothetical protein